MRYGLFRMTATADPTVAKAREMEEELTRLAYIEDPEDPEFVEINPIAILQGLINVMDLQIGKVIRVKRALALAGVDPEEVAMAIADTAKAHVCCSQMDYCIIYTASTKQTS